MNRAIFFAALLLLGCSDDPGHDSADADGEMPDSRDAAVTRFDAAADAVAADAASADASKTAPANPVAARGDAGVPAPVMALPTGFVRSCTGGDCPKGECGWAFANDCKDKYVGSYDEKSDYCSTMPEANYCFTTCPSVGESGGCDTDVFATKTTYVLSCSDGKASGERCPNGCGAGPDEIWKCLYR